MFVFIFTAHACRDVPQNQLLQSYIYGRYREHGYKHDFEPSMIHPDPVVRQVTHCGVEDGQFDDADISGADE